MKLKGCLVWTFFYDHTWVIRAKVFLIFRARTPPFFGYTLIRFLESESSLVKNLDCNWIIVIRLNSVSYTIVKCSCAYSTVIYGCGTKAEKKLVYGGCCGASLNRFSRERKASSHSSTLCIHLQAQKSK